MIQFTSSSQEAPMVKLTNTHIHFVKLSAHANISRLLISGMSSDIGVRHAERGSSMCKPDVDMKLDLAMPEFDHGSSWCQEVFVICHLLGNLITRVLFFVSSVCCIVNFFFLRLHSPLVLARQHPFDDPFSHHPAK
jgi:hypothetical protein